MITKKILVIEDDNFSFALITDLLADIGYATNRIIRCALIAELEQVNTTDIELVLTDLTLPDAAFPESFVRVAGKFPYIPIIVLTGSGDTDIAIETIQKGAQDYLAKNELDAKTLKKAIEYAIERKRISDKILVEEQNLWAIINNTPDIIWSIDRNNKIISANNAFWARLSSITGKQKNEIQDNVFDSQLHALWLSYYEKAFKGEQYKMVWHEIKEGQVVYEEVSFNPVYGSDNKVIGISCFSRDITDQYKYLDKIEKQNEQFKQIAWAQSHEVRRPLATILGCAELLDIDNAANPENKIWMGHIKESAIALDNVIRKIVSLTEMSAS